MLRSAPRGFYRGLIPARATAFLAGVLWLTVTAPSLPAPQPRLARADLEVVDCLLPGQVRTLGSRTYLTQRRPSRTTASDCRIRGGEYVAYDRADIGSALAVWLPAAESGDSEAQANVGEIYEHGSRGEANYESAALWYQKAADQGLARARFNLGTLYERGLGVPEDRLRAINLYREAWGINDNNLLYQDAVEREQTTLRAALEEQLAVLEAQVGALEKQVLDLQDRLRQSAQANTTELTALKSLVSDLRRQQTKAQTQLAALPPIREPSTAGPASAPVTQVASVEVRGLKLGRYYALVIGNQTYSSIEPLSTPRSDAERAARVLKDRYGFSVRLIEDADDVTMLSALNDMAQVLGPEDNLLIYYAGHGVRLKNAARESGYWLPVNANAPPNDTLWVPNEQITGHLSRFQARRVLVVADSCYAGLLSDDPSSLFLKDPGSVSLDYVRFKLPQRARLLISSGGDSPVLDQGGDGNSVFSRAFLEVLEQNTGVLSAPALFVRVQAKVRAAAARAGFPQVPEFKALKGAGHAVGDFFLIPKK